MRTPNGSLEIEVFSGGGNDDALSVLSEMPAFDEKEKPKKTYQEKAKENNYFQDEKGNWWRKGDEVWGDDRVDSFKLDVEYPELAEKVEELASRYGIELYDGEHGFKKLIYDHAEELQSADDEHLKNIFMTRAVITSRIGGTEKYLINCEPEKLSKIVDALDSFYEKVMTELPEEASVPSFVGQVAEALVINYNDKLVEGDFVEQLSKYTLLAGDAENRAKILDGIREGLRGFSVNEDSGELFGKYMDYYTSLLDDNERITKYETKRAVLQNYVVSHGFKKGTAEGFEKVIFPLLKQQDAELMSVFSGGNAYGVGEGEYGIADFDEECFLSSFRPAEIDKLVRIYHEIPTSDFARFEQNRKDAFRLQETIIGGRDFIHDERVGTHEILKAMKDYYEHRDREDAREYRSKLEKLEEKYHFGVLPNALDLEAYEKPIRKMADHSKAKLGDPDERAIDILNRLVENTAPDSLEVPQTKNERLNKLMKGINPIVNEETGEVKVELKDVVLAISEMNTLIRENYGKQGISPSIISAVAYLDKMAGYALKNCSKKELPELLFDSGFKEVVRFSQLTSSIDYSDAGFEAKYNRLVRAASEAYGMDEAGKEEAKDALRQLSQWITKNASDLGKKYNKKQTTKRYSEAVWSGNLSDELINLFERIN